MAKRQSELAKSRTSDEKGPRGERRDAAARCLKAQLKANLLRSSGADQYSLRRRGMPRASCAFSIVALRDRVLLLPDVAV